MSDQNIDNSNEAFEKALKDEQETKYLLRLYVSGNTPKSAHAILNLHEVIESYLKGRYELEVIDIYQQPERAKTDQILATPTLVKRLPVPIRKIIGDLSEVEKVLVGLDLITYGPEDHASNEPGKG